MPGVLRGVVVVGVTGVGAAVVESIWGGGVGLLPEGWLGFHVGWVGAVGVSIGVVEVD